MNHNDLKAKLMEEFKDLNHEMCWVTATETPEVIDFLSRTYDEIAMAAKKTSPAQLTRKEVIDLAKELLNLNGVPSCTYLHHKSSHRHGDDTECLAEKRYNEISAAITQSSRQLDEYFGRNV